ncbi:hypothetical protein AOLI_G00281740 [Acnodon oligacanthus]
MQRQRKQRGATRNETPLLFLINPGLNEVAEEETANGIFVLIVANSDSGTASSVTAVRLYMCHRQFIIGQQRRRYFSPGLFPHRIPALIPHQREVAITDPFRQDKKNRRCPPLRRKGCGGVNTRRAFNTLKGQRDGGGLAF